MSKQIKLPVIKQQQLANTTRHMGVDKNGFKDIDPFEAFKSGYTHGAIREVINGVKFAQWCSKENWKYLPDEEMWLSEHTGDFRDDEEMLEAFTMEQLQQEANAKKRKRKKT